jgi:hypothetical protein
MSANTTVPADPILSRRAYASDLSDRARRPGFFLYLSQGAMAGLFVYYAAVIVQLVTTRHYDYQPDPYSMMWMGIVVGVFTGFVLWICTPATYGRLPWLFRSAIAWLALKLLTGILLVDVPNLPSPPKTFVWALATNAVFGLVIGSRIHPLRALVRGGGTVGRKSAVLAGITGLLLRLWVLYWFMVMLIFTAAVLTNEPEEHRIKVWLLLVTGHFAAGVLALFIPMRFQALAIAVVIVNAPVVMYMVEFRHELREFNYILGSYLAAWAVFLLTRWRQTYETLASLPEEIRYYLID